MNTNHPLPGIAWRVTGFLALVAALALGATAQGFSTGSDGSLGDVVIDANTTLDLPPDGILHYRSLTVNAGVRLRFNRNARNTPVHILSQGDVVVAGTIDVNGARGNANTGGVAGPGGFDGGAPGFGPNVPPGDGMGPGGGVGGPGGCDPATQAGGGSYGGRFGGANNGQTYGSVLLIPLIGGSGGGGGVGQPGEGGGGGGGAILIASGTRIAVTGVVEAFGGQQSTCLNAGSGGAIRLVAPRVEGSGRIDVRGGGGHGGAGRIRVDCIDRTGLSFNFQAASVTSIGGNLFIFPPTIPTLATIETAGISVPQGGGPVTFTLPFGSSPEQTIKVRAADFGRVVPIRVTLTPTSGPRVVVDAEVDNTSANPAVVEVPVTLPVNTLVTVHAWTR